MVQNLQCPQCHQPLTQVGDFWICPKHGQISIDKPHAPLRIFLSYGHDANEELVRRIKADLENRGHDVWFDKSEIKFGDDWRHSITDGILKSNRVLTFLSKHSTRDPGVCVDEIGIAIGVKGGNVQTILVEGEAEVQPPPSISHIQWLDMHEWKDKQVAGETIWEAWYDGKFAEIARVVESDESVRFAGEIEDLMSKLKPVKSDTKMGELLRKPFIGRAWMHAAVETWRNKRDDDSRLFWIIGNPGVGKSAFVANLAHFGKARVIALHFCEWNKQSHKDPRQVVLNIAFQLACRLADYRKLLLTLPQIDSLAARSETELFDYLLVEPLRSVIDGGRERFLVIIDALDEANAGGRNAVAELLAQHTRRLPEWLGILITSRPEEEVMTPLRGLSGLKPFMLDTARQENLDDIRSYLRHELPDASEAEIDAILNKSGGVFLYAKYVCEELRHNRLFLDRLDAFPHGLGGIYAQYFARQFPDLANYKRATRHVLGVLAAAREPLEPGFLAALFGWDTYHQREDFFDSMGSLLRLSANTVHPFHKSLFDWLSDKSKSGSYFVSTGEGQKQLADHGMHEYRRSVQDLSAYNLRHLPTHLTELERWEDLISDDKTPGPLTDLLYIQAKCEASLVHELVSDYNVALAALPEFAEENERNKRRDAAMMAYNKALRGYAVVRYDWFQAKEHGEFRPEPLYPSLPAELKEGAEIALPEESSPRASRLRHFSNFVSGHIALLNEHPCGTLPLAFNQAKEGPVEARAAQQLIDLKESWIRRTPRPPTPPLRPQCLRTLEGHKEWVKSVIVSPDGRHAVSGSDDNTLRVWDLETGQCLRTLKGHSEGVESVSVSPDGRRAVSGSYDETLRVWDLETGQCLRTLEGHAEWVESVSVSPDGRRAVSGSYDKTLRVWDLETGRCLRILIGHAEAIHCVSVSPDGRRVVSGSWGNTLRVWNLESGQCLRTLEGHADGVWSVSVSPDGRRAVSGSYDKTLRVWDLETGQCLRILEGHAYRVFSVSVSPDGRRAVSGGEDSFGNTLPVWDLETGQCLRTLEGHAKWVNSVSVSPDGRRAVSGSYDKTLRVWDLETGQCLATLEGHANEVMSVSVSPDGRRAVSGSGDKTLRVWDLETGQCLRTLEGHADRVSSVSVSPDGQRAVSGSLDKTLRVWDLETGQCLRTLEGHEDQVWIMNVSPDGRRAVSGGRDKTLRVWNLETGQCLRTLEGHADWVSSVSVSPDGRRAVSGGCDKTIRVWNLETGQCLRSLKGHATSILSVSVSPDGRRAVSGSRDKTLRFWDLETGKCMAVYHCGASASSAAFSSDGTRIVCGTADGQMHFLTPVNFPPSGPPIVTPVRLWLFGDNGAPGRWDDQITCRCAHCGRLFEPPPLNAENHAECPHCAKPLELDPINDESSHEAALRGGLELCRQNLGDHADTVGHLKALAKHLEKQQQQVEADELIKMAVDMAARLTQIQITKEPLSFRNRARDLVVEGKYEEARRILDQLLVANFEIPGTHCHIARICLLTDHFSDVRQHAASAWEHRTEAPPYVVPRILWFQILAAMLANDVGSRTKIEPLLDMMKASLNNDDAFSDWTMQPVLDHLKPWLSELDHALLASLVAALSDRTKLPELEQFTEWRNAIPQPLD